MKVSSARSAACPSLFFGLEVNEIFGIEEARGIGSVVRTANLAGGDSHLGEGRQDDARSPGPEVLR